MKRPLCELAVAAVVALVACGGDSGGPGPDPDDPDAAGADFDRAALLENIGTNIVLPVYERFATDVTALGAAIGDYCTALETADEAARRTDARTAYATAMDTWQIAESMLIGPASPAGDALRDAIYSWPIVSPCAIDQDIVLARNDPDSYDLSSRLPNRRGLYVVEYLLFQDDLESLCTPAQVPPEWAGLTAIERRAARCAFLTLAAADLSIRATALVTAWSPEGGDFAGQLAAAGEAGSPFASQTEALNAVFGALFYIDLMAKDQKVAEPAGLRANSCGTTDEPCLAELESRFADRGVGNLTANLDGFELVYAGKGVDGEDRLGFDDFLRAVGQPSIADGMTTDIAAARAAIGALPSGLRQALEDSYAAVVTTHGRLRDVTVHLKNEMPDALGLEIPDEVAGDTD